MLNIIEVLMKSLRKLLAYRYTRELQGAHGKRTRRKDVLLSEIPNVILVDSGWINIWIIISIT